MPMRPEPCSPTVVVNRELLRERLSPIEYQVTQEKQTERSTTISTIFISPFLLLTFDDVFCVGTTILSTCISLRFLFIVSIILSVSFSFHCLMFANLVCLVCLIICLFVFLFVFHLNYTFSLCMSFSPLLICASFSLTFVLLVYSFSSLFVYASF